MTPAVISPRTRNAARSVLCVACLFAGNAAAQGPGAQALTATRERPLFSPTRRPPPPPAPVVVEPVRTTEAPPPVVPPPVIQVIGIVFSDNQGVAFVRRAKDVTTTHLRVGDQIDGWTVDDIRPRDLLLKLGPRELTLGLSTTTATSTPVTSDNVDALLDAPMAKHPVPPATAPVGNGARRASGRAD